MQIGNLTRWLASIQVSWNWALRRILLPLYDVQTSQALSSAGLTISTTKTLVKTGAADSYYMANGVVVEVDSGTDLSALDGTVANAEFGVFCFFIDAAGTVTTAFGESAASLAVMQFPQKPVGKALMGWVLINPTGTGDFVGGTTDLDDVTVVPNAVYFNTSACGGFDPYCLIGGQLGSE